MAPFALVGMAGGLALFWAAPFALARAWLAAGAAAASCCSPRSGRSPTTRAAHVLTGFPWGLLGYAWVETPVIQAVALFGPHGLGFLTLVAGAPARARLLARARRSRRRWSRRAGASAPGGWRSRCRSGPSRWSVRLVQPNARPGAEVAAGHGAGLLRPPPRAHRAPAEPRPDVTIWSETAVPFVLGDAPELLAESAAAAGAGGRLILGIRRSSRRRRASAGTTRSRCSTRTGRRRRSTTSTTWCRSASTSPSPAPIARLGLPGLATLTRGGFTRRRRAAPRRGAGPAAVPAADLLRGDLSRARCSAPEGRAEWLVQVTNDAWFGDGLGAVPALRPGAGPGDRAGPAAGARRQYRDLGDGRSVRPGSREPRS